MRWHSDLMYRQVRPLLFQFNAERAHGLALAALRLPVPHAARPDPILAQSLFGLTFNGPVGLAAGFDKDGKVAHRVGRLGFDYAELGTLTPLPQKGNPRPRLFRLEEDRAVINRLGFNNEGQALAAERLARHGTTRKFIVGINIGANKDAPDRIADYETGVRQMSPYAHYLTVNVSSPNTPGLRALQDRGALDELLGRVIAARAPDGPPILLKIAPDLVPADIENIAELSLEHRIDGLIVTNTTISRPPLLSPHAGESGGLSGAPLHDLAAASLRDFRKLLGKRMPLIGVGGITTAAQAYARIRAGASLLQLYSAMLYEGPYLPARINVGLAELLRRDGFSSITQAVGVDTD